ncbi:MAG: DnaB-like helicase C-terminal domain-containing protein, partial [Chitinophagaceae bacterium]|nr:DnaB-like helicase C-terminal domain-containing protein [Chitinophagaceae bacterium]
EQGESTKGETHIRIAKHRNGSLETIKLRALLHIQKFVDADDDNNNFSMGSNWKPVPSSPVDSKDDDGARLYIQKESSMKNMDYNNFDGDNAAPF